MNSSCSPRRSGLVRWERGRDTEGPSVLHSGDYRNVYYDECTRGRNGAVRTRDFMRREPFRDSLETPREVRHGSAFVVPKSILKGLMVLDSTTR